MVFDVKLTRRKEATLLRWYWLFATWKWPKDYPADKPTASSNADEIGTINRLCDRIQMELGRRTLVANRWGKNQQ